MKRFLGFLQIFDYSIVWFAKELKRCSTNVVNGVAAVSTDLMSDYFFYDAKEFC